MPYYNRESSRREVIRGVDGSGEAAIIKARQKLNSAVRAIVDGWVNHQLKEELEALPPKELYAKLIAVGGEAQHTQDDGDGNHADTPNEPVAFRSQRKTAMQLKRVILIRTLHRMINDDVREWLPLLDDPPEGEEYDRARLYRTRLATFTHVSQRGFWSAFVLTESAKSRVKEAAELIAEVLQR